MCCSSIESRVIVVIVLLVTFWYRPITEFQASSNESDVDKHVDAFLGEPSTGNLATVLDLLELKLAQWDLLSKESTCAIIGQIERHRIAEAKPILLRFLEVDTSLDGADLIAAYAVRALGEIGGQDVDAALLDLATRATPFVLPTVAVMLAQTDDPRAIVELERLALHSEAAVRHRAVAGLARFCSASSQPVVHQLLDDNNDKVRSSATWWFAACGTPDDSGLLVRQLADPAPLARANAIKGLIRLGSTAGCQEVPRLLRDQSPEVRDVIDEYQERCSEG